MQGSLKVSHHFSGAARQGLSFKPAISERARCASIDSGAGLNYALVGRDGLRRIFFLLVDPAELERMDESAGAACSTPS